MLPAFDLVFELQEAIDDYFHRTGRCPERIAMSPNAFQWLLVIFKEDEAIFGFNPLDPDEMIYTTPIAQIRVQLDEKLGDTDLIVS
ncbi:MAG: hypothetical protein GXO82_08920 [Chlorobi bacterium]|nr:hypothetical protein [Chlorobiota bacterium]